LLDVLEKVKAMDGVNDTIWSEVVEVVGRKRSIPSHIIDRLYKQKQLYRLGDWFFQSVFSHAWFFQPIRVSMLVKAL
jgi:hypothetical protein